MASAAADDTGEKWKKKPQKVIGIFFRFLWMI